MAPKPEGGTKHGSKHDRFGPLQADLNQPRMLGAQIFSSLRPHLSCKALLNANLVTY